MSAPARLCAVDALIPSSWRARKSALRSRARVASRETSRWSSSSSSSGSSAAAAAIAWRRSAVDTHALGGAPESEREQASDDPDQDVVTDPAREQLEQRDREAHDGDDREQSPHAAADRPASWACSSSSPARARAAPAVPAETAVRAGTARGARSWPSLAASGAVPQYGHAQGQAAELAIVSAAPQFSQWYVTSCRPRGRAQRARGAARSRARGELARAARGRARAQGARARPREPAARAAPAASLSSASPPQPPTCPGLRTSPRWARRCRSA